ncbi:uncharacterized protein [Parasteatoda tepidariorum]|uniref:uncharacterized protein n=1 Tax=Parasteatoda tepidariorum TaxID=114398 RepID=UPI0039BD8F02
MVTRAEAYSFLGGVVSLRPKLWLQNLWKAKIGWDDEVDTKTREDFAKWLSQLEYLKHIEISRWLHCDKGYERISLHFFCDASKFAYSTVVFLKIEDESNVQVHLIQSKARIAPSGKKETTIARLELLGATIAALSTDKVHFWTDSTTVLAWLKREDTWGVFVENRVQEIRKLTPVKAWRHLPGSMNPAHLPSRGCSAQQLGNSKWWEGPSWLYLSHTQWPAAADEISVNEEEVYLEKRKQVVISMVNIEVTEIWCNYFSTYSRNVRVVAWILRFVHNVSHQDKLKGNLICEELTKAESVIFKSMQTTHFQDDKFLAKIQAFRDKSDILRVKTKLVHSDENENFRCPILLPANSVVLELIREEHIKAMHAGRSILLSRLRERYWILKAKKLVNKVISKCVTCKRHQAKPVEVPFAPLPRERVTQTKVFQVSGVDYAGPLYLKSNEKAWIVLFTCAVYRAVHFELVRSLTTDAFIQAFRRFIARRGRISVIYSDNGKNFVGANNYLKNLDWDKIAVYSTAQKIIWKFIPPTAAWWGGWGERIVGMLKTLLRSVLGKSVVDYEELTTILCDCESVINSRPLTYIHDNPSELVPLTPATFIYGEGSNSNETPDLDLVNRISMLKRVKFLQKLREDLKQRFRNEYLAQLVHKGIRRNDVINIGDIVLIGQDNARRIDWPLGIVLELYPGKDSIPRVARLRTSQGERIRPFQRLYPLELSAKNDMDFLEKSSKKINWEVDNIPKSVDVPDNLEVNSLIKGRLGRIIKIPQRLDL